MLQRSRLLSGLVALALVSALLATPPITANAEEDAESQQEDEESGGFFTDLKEGVLELKDDAVAQVPDVPAGAVIAFNREECPLGWSEFPPAVGRVIVGVGDLEEGRTTALMQIGEAERAAASTGGATVAAGPPWLGLLYCEKD